MERRGTAPDRTRASWWPPPRTVDRGSGTLGTESSNILGGLEPDAALSTEAEADHHHLHLPVEHLQVQLPDHGGQDIDHHVRNIASDRNSDIKNAQMQSASHHQRLHLLHLGQGDPQHLLQHQQSNHHLQKGRKNPATLTGWSGASSSSLSSSQASLHHHHHLQQVQHVRKKDIEKKEERKAVTVQEIINNFQNVIQVEESYLSVPGLQTWQGTSGPPPSSPTSPSGHSPASDITRGRGWGVQARSSDAPKMGDIGAYHAQVMLDCRHTNGSTFQRKTIRTVESLLANQLERTSKISGDEMIVIQHQQQSGGETPTNSNNTQPEEVIEQGSD